ncbi:MAG: hypothetical protein WCK32_00700 [Chlorobiaceae bacterium]
MPFNWRKEKSTKPLPRPRIPIKIISFEKSETPSSLNENIENADIREHERIKVIDESNKYDIDFVEGHPHGPCGFTTCVQDGVFQSYSNIIEPESTDLNEQLPADEFFRSGKREADSLTNEERPIVPDQCINEHAPNNNDNVSLWSNRNKK